MAEVMERNDGVRKVLLNGAVYRAVQRSVGADKLFRFLAAEVIPASAEQSVVDIGCGTADIAEHIEFASYTGFDPNPAYVERARARLNPRYGDRATVIVGGVGDDALAALPTSVDVAMAIGVLHHLDDDTADQALALAADVLAPGGRLVTVDPGLVEGQHRVARALVSRDRGQHVRTPEATAELVRRRFPDAVVTVRHDLLHVPYTHLLVEAPAPAA